MAIEINTKVSLGETVGRKLGNLTLEDAKFFGRPNFSGEMDQFKDDRRKFTVLIPNELADQLRQMGWNVKTNIPTQAELEQFPDREPISHLRVMVDDNSLIQIRIDNDIQTLVPASAGQPGTFGAMDRIRVETMDMEIRAWEFNPAEKPGEYSARLVALVALVRPNIMAQKWGTL